MNPFQIGRTATFIIAVLYLSAATIFIVNQSTVTILMPILEVAGVIFIYSFSWSIGWIIRGLIGIPSDSDTYSWGP